jgi:hypothetical protein
MQTIKPELKMFEDEDFNLITEWTVFVSAPNGDDGDIANARSEGAAWRKAARTLRKLAKEAELRGKETTCS